MSKLEKVVKDAGFESEAEFHRLIGEVDLTSAEKIKAFKKWQFEDGTKDGLLKLPKAKEEKSNGPSNGDRQTT